MPEVSIVIPVFNEEPCIRPLAGVLDEFLSEFDRPAEIIFVDDGSTDGSQDLLAQVIAEQPGWRLVTLRANKGQTVAMAAGLHVARGRIVVFMDADLQNDPRDIPRLVNRIDEGFDLVSGWRRDRKDRTLSRKIPSRIANWIIGRVTGVRVHDYGCTLKAYRASLVKPLHLYSDMHRFLPALCSRAGARITEIVVAHHPRRLGSSKYGLNRIFKVAADLVVIKMIVDFSDRPMHYFGISSAFFLMLSGVALGVWIWNLAEGWREGSIILPAVIVLFFCAFLYFLFLGLLADLAVRLGPDDPSGLTIAAGRETRP